MKYRIESSLLLTLSAILFIMGSWWLYKICIVKFYFKETKGQILQAKVIEIDQSDETGEKNTKAFIPNIKFQYLINEKIYISENYSVNFRGGEKDWASAIVKSYPTGHIVTIYYHPMNPENSVLIKDIPKYLLADISGAYLASFGAFIFGIERLKKYQNIKIS